MHNEFRNRTAAGEVDGYSPAVRMATLEWDDELAQLAELNVKTCVFKHDKCRNTDLFRYAGQNLAIRENSIEADVFDDVYFLTQSWFEEYKDATQAVIDQYFPIRGFV